MKAVNFVIANYALILGGILSILVALGAIVEVLGRFFPTKDGQSVLSKLAKSLDAAGKFVKKAMDVLKIPNNKA